MILPICPNHMPDKSVSLHLSVAALNQSSAFSEWNIAHALNCLPLRSQQPSLTRAGWSSWSPRVIKSSFCLEPIYSFPFPSFMPLWGGSSYNCSCSSKLRHETLTGAQIPHCNWSWWARPGACAQELLQAQQMAQAPEAKGGSDIDTI